MYGFSLGEWMCLEVKQTMWQRGERDNFLAHCFLQKIKLQHTVIQLFEILNCKICSFFIEVVYLTFKYWCPLAFNFFFIPALLQAVYFRTYLLHLELAVHFYCLKINFSCSWEVHWSICFSSMETLWHFCSRKLL